MRIEKFLFLPFILLAALCASRAEDDSINWLGNYQEALRVARETGKPIFLEFRCEA